LYFRNTEDAVFFSLKKSSWPKNPILL
jgi:hypothetical protein